MQSKKDLINYLSKKTGLPVYDEIEITFEDNYKRTYRKQIWVKINGYEYQVHKNQIKGGVFVMRVNSCSSESPFCFQDIPIDYPIDKMFYKDYRDLEDFYININTKRSSYKNCESNGYYSMVDVYYVDGLEFANI